MTTKRATSKLPINNLDAPALPRKRLFTVDEYYKLVKVGILNEDDRVELIEGEIIEMAAKGGPHVARVIRLIRVFSRILGDRGTIMVQDPLRLSNLSEPEPDFMLVRIRADDYETGPPTPSDVYLLIEVSDTTVSYDRNVKLPLYAREMIPEFWLVEVNPPRITVHRSPSAGGYQDIQIKRRGDRVTVLAFPDMEFAVDEIIG